jgi:8-oxo-dGTP pyrophosphatase MutT (NUDIX family)
LRDCELPGGGRRARASLEQAVRREIREELGLEALTAELRGVCYEPEYDQHHFAFRCQLPDGVDPKPSSAEILECAYWPVAIRVLGPRQLFT